MINCALNWVNLITELCFKWSSLPPSSGTNTDNSFHVNERHSWRWQTTPVLYDDVAAWRRIAEIIYVRTRTRILRCCDKLACVHVLLHSRRARGIIMAESRPRKTNSSLIVHDGEIGIMTPGRSFQSHTNFCIEVVHAVQSPKNLAPLFGFVFLVRSTNRVERWVVYLFSSL